MTVQSVWIFPVNEMIKIGPEELEASHMSTVFVFDSQG